MRNRGDKFLLAFLGAGVLVYLISLGVEEDSPAGLDEDLTTPDPESSMVRAWADSKTESQREISLQGYSLQAETATHWKLPGRLVEISGLAMTVNNRLLAHNDERGIIYEIDYRNKSIVKAFQLADMENPVADDFEGIATADGQVYLVTSLGRLYECREGTGGESVLYNIYTTGVGRECEIEGLAYDQSQRALLLMCKGPRIADLEGQLVVYHWSIDDKQLLNDARTIIPMIEFSRHLGERKFHPSGIERHPGSGNYYVVAARQGAIAEIESGGQVVSVRRFTAPWHRQVEGITFAADNTLIVADEGVGGKARLTLYPVSVRGQ